MPKVCNQRLCSRLKKFWRSKHASTSTATDRPQKLQRTGTAPTVSGVTLWEVFDGLSVTRKSHLKIKHENFKKEEEKKQKKARDGKRSAMYRLNCPVETKEQQLYNGTVIGFLCHIKNAVHMWSNGFKQTPQSAHVNVLYVPENSETHVQIKQQINWTVIPVEPKLFSHTPPKNKNKKKERKVFVHLFLRRGSHESWRTWTRNL